MSDTQKTRVDKKAHFLWAALVAVVVVGGVIMNGTIINENRDLNGKVRGYLDTIAQQDDTISLLRTSDMSERAVVVRQAVQEYCK